MRTKHFSCLCVVVCCFLMASAWAVDFGDAPLPYPVTLVEDGARHKATGPTLGYDRDSESDGTHSAAADADDTNDIDDEDGVSFGTIQAGRLGASVTVNVQNAGGGAKLDAWIDFNGDGCWGGPFEQIADNVTVADGNNIIIFDVPSWAVDGQSFARFRLSTAGDLGPGGAAADGEVEDYQVIITAPAAATGLFGPQNVITDRALAARSVFAADVDGDGDMDALSADYVEVTWYGNEPSQNFTAHTIVEACVSESVFAADVDGDGDMDVLSASDHFCGYGIAWHENDGSENFTVHSIDPNSQTPESVFAADVDGDGDMDVLSTCGRTITWYKNDGSENFTTHTITEDANRAESVFAADVDGDGDMDVLSTSFDDGTIAWYENDGSENFTGHTITTDAKGARSVFAADVDGDGDMDVLSASSDDDKIAWYANDGSENFTAHNIATDVNNAYSVFAADVDGDGDMDVLSVSWDDDKIAWYANDGNENFVAHTITTEARHAASVFAADVDGDGDLDVLSASYSDDTIAWYENLGLTFDFGDAPAPYPATLSEDGARHRPTGPRLGDDRDGESDGTHSAAADADDTNDIDDEDGVSFGTIQTGQLGVSVTVNVQNCDPNAKLDAWIDFNGDGCWGGPFEQIADNVTVADGNNIIIFDVPSWAINGQSYARFRLSTAGDLAPGGAADDGEVEDYEVTITAPAAASGVFDELNVITTDAYGAVSVFAADVDGDGDLDALSASLYDNKIAWYEHDGTGNFTAHTITAAAYGAVSVFAADVDGDGDMDVLSASSDSRIAWYANDGNESFTAYTITTAASGAESVFAADVDGDGDMDVLSASWWDNKIAWYKNDGSENFTPYTITTEASGAESVFAADVDSDGDMDVLSASGKDNKIAWYANNGSENFTDHVITINVPSARSVFAADVDGDGDMDVLSASGNAGIAWYANDGNESFTGHNIDAGWSASVFAGDVDGDGDVDVLSTTSPAQIVWYANDGSQNFTAHTVTTYANNVNSVFAGDVDGDGDLDVLSACGTDNTIAWYENSNCVVDFEDLGYFVDQWLVSGDVEANFDWDDNPVPDNRVDLYDFSYLAYYWMTWCPEGWPW